MIIVVAVLAIQNRVVNEFVFPESRHRFGKAREIMQSVPRVRATCPCHVDFAVVRTCNPKPYP